MPALTKPRPQTRLLASVGDLVPIAGCFGVFTLAGVLVRAAKPGWTEAQARRDVDPLVVDAGVLVMSVLPVGIYLAVSEAGAAQATLGKRWTGLRVVGDDGGRAGGGQIVRRTAVKLLAWQLGHMAFTRQTLGGRQPVVLWSCYVLSLGIPMVSVTLALRDPEGRALHDRAARTRVVVLADDTDESST